MIPGRQFVRRHQFAIYLILAYAMSWATAILLDGAILPYGPALAAIIVLGIAGGRVGLAGLWSQTTHWRVRWTWYLIAPGIIAAISLGAFALNLLFGATVTDTNHLQSWTLALGALGVLLVFGGQWEEPGWSGYALPFWQERLGSRSSWGVVAASLITGAARSFWHLPLVLSGAIPWHDALLYAFAMQFLITWLYNGTGGSVLIVMLLHLASNVLLGAIFIPLFAGDDRTRYFWLFSALAWLMVLAILRIAGPDLGWKRADVGGRVGDVSAPTEATRGYVNSAGG